jgi:hypothetical protein
VTAAPIRLTGPDSIVEAIPYLLGFAPTDSLVLVGLHAGSLTVTARVDLDDLDRPAALADLMTVLATTADSSEVMALTYGDRPEAAAIAAAADAAGMRLLEHLRVADGRYWSLTCPIEGCCPAEGRPLPTGNAVAAEFVGLGATTAPSRDELAAHLDPQPDTERLGALIGEREAHQLAQARDGLQDARVHADQRALRAAARRQDRTWSDAETARFGVALADHLVRDAIWLAIDEGLVDAQDLMLHLARTLPAPYRAAPLFLFAWKAWREGNGALAAMAVERTLQADPNYSAAELLSAALARGVDPRRMPTLRLDQD